MLLAQDNTPGASEQWADIYWGLIQPETSKGGGVKSLYTDWKPWLHMLNPYAPPPDPLHVTLFYDRDETWVYHDAFMTVEGTEVQVETRCLLAGPEGIAAVVELNDELLQYYEMTKEAVPHITLAVHSDHQAKELGPMTKRLLKASDWEPTQIPNVSYSASEKAYQITQETLFTDGCCFRHPTEGLKAAWAVVRRRADGFETITAERVTGKESAQLAELQAMIAALEWAEGKSVNIYTDSAYMVGAIQVELSQWIRSNFLTSKTPIKHEKDIKRLAEALMKPRQVAVIKCKGHDKTETLTARGNDAADQAAKLKAGYGTQYMMVAGIQGGAEQAPAPKDTEWVLLKVIKRKWSEPRWTGPYRVTERTSHAVRLDGKEAANVENFLNVAAKLSLSALESADARMLGCLAQHYANVLEHVNR
ncbi:Gag-Pol polyprotein [Merluccius polli]|uniref:Gag-Pol polyprotein n=1 Tax=Merluccius polli TaxID=89951 RepID=A0AA47M720_MERPO|nr:Gag-Pol polyprotein [Merluccius polli]